jgi:hypothetical protein
MRDPYNCKHEYEQEEIEMAMKQQHEEGNCPGYPECIDCCALRDERQEKDRAEGRYIGDRWTKE